MTATLAPLRVTTARSIAALVGVQVLAGRGRPFGAVAAQGSVASFGAGRDRERRFGWYGAFVSIGSTAALFAARRDRLAAIEPAET
jgi:hypothetical protein